MTLNVRAFASTQYVRRYGTPQGLDDLDDGHRIVSYGGTPVNHLTVIRWLETAGRNGKEPRVPVFRANSVVALKYAIRAGIGIGVIPDYLTEEETDLVPVLGEAELPTIPLIFVYPEELKTVARVQVFRDFVVSKAQRWPS